MNFILFIVVIGFWSYEGIRQLRRSSSKAKHKPVCMHPNKRVAHTFRYVNGNAYKEVCGWTIE